MKDVKMLNRAEYAEKKKAEKEAVYKIADKAAIDVSESSEKYIEFLDTMARTGKLSATNALLVYAQDPEAARLRSFEDWNEDGVHINKGEKGISILEPRIYTKADGSDGMSFSVKKVFDIRQTDAAKTVKVTDSRRLYDSAAAIIDGIESSGGRVSQAALNPGQAAFYDSMDKTLYIGQEAGSVDAVFTCLATEAAYMQLDTGTVPFDRQDHSFVAASASYIMCRKQGADISLAKKEVEKCFGKSFESCKVITDGKPDMKATAKNIRAKLSDIRECERDITDKMNSEIIKKMRSKEPKSKEARGN